MMFGRVDEVDGHYIATNFVAGTIPIACMYIARDNKRSEIRIRPDVRSIALGYARVWLPIVAAATVIAPLLHGHIGVSAVVTAVALVVIAVAARTFGQLPEAEKIRLRLLGTVTGFRLDPARLLDQTRNVKREQLGELMEKGGIPITPDGIIQVLDDIPVPAMPLVYGYACYADEEADPAWRECAAIVYERYAQADLGG